MPARRPGRQEGSQEVTPLLESPQPWTARWEEASLLLSWPAEPGGRSPRSRCPIGPWGRPTSGPDKARSSVPRHLSRERRAGSLVDAPAG